MTNIQDLHIKSEILPLFDFTCNDFTRDVLIDILANRLNSVAEIQSRQEILRGFNANYNSLKAHSYSPLDLKEVYDFLSSFGANKTAGKELTLHLLLSAKERHQKRGRFVQLILLFEKLYAFYFARLTFKSFPETYKKDLQNLDDFFSTFDIKLYASLIREKGLKIKHIVELTDIVLIRLNDDRIEKFWKDLFLFEAYLSISLGIVKHGFTFASFSQTAFSIDHFYHPLLKHPVKNSFAANSNVIILTGPNMSGKSTFLRAISLCVYLAHIGIGVPASKAELPFFENISVAINLNDDIISGYSHFMTEVINLKQVVTQASQNQTCFAVFDELFRGTNIEDAVEISTTTIKGLTKFKNSLFFVSTHLHQLKETKEVKTNTIATYYLDCELKELIPHFNYRLKQGWSEIKVGRLLFDKEGLNQLFL